MAYAEDQRALEKQSCRLTGRAADHEAFLEGKLEDIRRYCETDVMNTYLLYCRFQKMRGGFTEAEYDQEIAFVKDTLGALAPAEAHWREYLDAWR